MKRNFWLWTVLVVSLIYGILFWYSQYSIEDGEETVGRAPVLSEKRSEDPVGSPSGKRIVTDSIKI